MTEPPSKISLDIDLLEMCVDDMTNCTDIYRPGPYWYAKAKAAAREIREFGLSDFRGYTTGIATSYGDNPFVDTRSIYNYGIKSLVTKSSRKLFPLKQIFDYQVELTRSHYEETVRLRAELFRMSPRVRELLQRYQVPHDNCRGGCKDFSDFDGERISHHYLATLDTLDVIAKRTKLNEARTHFEIGGGFGVYTHLLIENFPSLRKFIYLDIAPNLYVGTQYLRSFYGSSVISYMDTRKQDSITFSENDDLEILCILPAQVEKLTCQIDVFHNSQSFVEMPRHVVANYADHVKRLLAPHGTITLVTYDGFDLSTTIHPDELPSFFSADFSRELLPTLRPERQHYYFIA